MKCLKLANALNFHFPIGIPNFTTEIWFLPNFSVQPPPPSDHHRPAPVHKFNDVEVNYSISATTTTSTLAAAPIEVMEAINLEVSEPQPLPAASGLPTSFQNGDQERSQDSDHSDQHWRRESSTSSPRRTHSWSASSNTNRVTPSTSEAVGTTDSISRTSPSSRARNQRRISSQPSMRQYSRLSRSSRGHGRTWRS